MLVLTNCKYIFFSRVALGQMQKMMRTNSGMTVVRLGLMYPVFLCMLVSEDDDKTKLKTTYLRATLHDATDFEDNNGTHPNIASRTCWSSGTCQRWGRGRPAFGGPWWCLRGPWCESVCPWRAPGSTRSCCLKRTWGRSLLRLLACNRCCNKIPSQVKLS